MSNAIQFLESLGSNAASSRLSAAEYTATVASLDIDAAQQQALLDRDEVRLNVLLGGLDSARCVIFTTDQEDSRAC